MCHTLYDSKSDTIYTILYQCPTCSDEITSPPRHTYPHILCSPCLGVLYSKFLWEGLNSFHGRRVWRKMQVSLLILSPVLLFSPLPCTKTWIGKRIERKKSEKLFFQVRVHFPPKCLCVVPPEYLSPPFTPLRHHLKRSSSTPPPTDFQNPLELSIKLFMF